MSKSPTRDQIHAVMKARGIRIGTLAQWVHDDTVISKTTAISMATVSRWLSSEKADTTITTYEAIKASLKSRGHIK